MRFVGKPWDNEKKKMKKKTHVKQHDDVNDQNFYGLCLWFNFNLAAILQLFKLFALII